MKKNILFLIGRMNSGGAERVIYNLCNNLKQEYNITLVVGSIKNADYIPDVQIIEIPEFTTRKKWFIGIYKLRQVKKKLCINTSISFLFKYNIYNYFSKYKDKIILSIRNDNSVIKKYPKYFQPFYKIAMKKANVIVNVSKSVMNDSILSLKSPIEKNIVIPNFCDLSHIKKERKNAVLKEHQKLFQGQIVISPGRYTYQKGQWHLIRAFKKIVENDNNVKLILTGRGVLKEYYVSLVKDLNLEKNVFILDYISNIYPYLYQADIYILTSFFEGMPNALLEAMACDLPVIATDSLGGTKEILEKNPNHPPVEKTTLTDYGVLIPCGEKELLNAFVPLTKDELEIANAILMLLNDKKLYKKYQEKSKSRIKDFQKEEILKMWKGIL